MAANTPGQQLNDLLVTRNFAPEALSAKTGKPPLDDQGAPDPEAADMFTFDWVADSGKNYGTVVCLLGADNNFEVYFGDNLGRGMDTDDKNDWYQFLDQLRNFAKRNLLRYDLQNLRRLKYTMAGMAAIKEGLFEGYYGNRKVSYAGEPTEARLMIRHSRPLDENDARFRHVESLFIETADGERFKLPFRKLAGGRAMLEHVRHGGTPYDARGQHISEMVEQINVLSQFRRAHQGRVFEGAAGELVAETTQYLDQLRHNLKTVANDRGYTQYFESWSPASVSESDLIVEDLRDLFVETRIDPRIEQALPMLARIQKEAQAMKEAEIFESWATRIVEGTWALPETPEQQDELKALMSQPLPVGADGMNATEQLYGLIGDDELFDIIGDIAATDPDANCWDDPRVQDRLEQLGVYMVSPAEPAAATETPPVTEGEVYDLGKEYGAPAPGRKPLPRGGSIPRRHEDDPDFMDPDQRRIRADQERVRKAQDEYHAKKGVTEGYQLDEGAVETITALVKKIPGIGKYYQLAQQYKPQLIQILKTSKSGKEVKQKMEQLVAQQPAPVAESGLLKQLGGLAVGGGSILSTMWMNAMGMIDGVLAHATAGEIGGAVASGSILGLIPVTLMLFAAMLLFKGSKQSSDEKAQAVQAQRGQQGMAEGHQAPAPGWYVTHELRSGDPDIVKGPFASQQQAQIWMNGNIPDADDPSERYEITQMFEGDNLATFEGSGCNMTAEGEYCPEHGLAECGNYGMYESELARIKSLALVR